MTILAADPDHCARANLRSIPSDLAHRRQRRARQPDAAGFAEALAQLILAVQRAPAEPMSGLAVITETAADIIPGVDWAAVVVPARRGRLGLRVGHGDVPIAVLNLQNETGQGPCLDAVHQASQIYVSDTATEGRWPAFRDRAVTIGALSMICTPLAAGTVSYGSLTLISGTAGAIDSDSARLAAVLAAHAAIALADAESRRQLSVAISSRDVIGQAKGILMERYRLTADAAFALLSRASQDANIKLRDVAAELCQTGGLP